MSAPAGHLDLDALADVLAGRNAQRQCRAPDAECAQCRAALEDRRGCAGTPRTSSALPARAMPDDVAARLGHAFRDCRPSRPAGHRLRDHPADGAVRQRRSAGCRPPQRSSCCSPAPATASAAWQRLDSSGQHRSERQRSQSRRRTRGSPSSATAPAPTTPTAPASRPRCRSSSRGRRRPSGTPSPAGDGTVAHAPEQAAGTAPARRRRNAAADPLARLRDNAGLADCLVALLPPGRPVGPAAGDGLRVVPRHAGDGRRRCRGSTADKLDVFVVGPGCSRDQRQHAVLHVRRQALTRPLPARGGIVHSSAPATAAA